MHKWRQRLPSGEPRDIEAPVRRHDGIFRWFLIRFEPFRDETGKIAMWYGVSTDIENLKQTEEKLREDERELRQITDAIPQAVVVQDPVGLPIYANRAALDYTGLSADDVMAPKDLSLRGRGDGSRRARGRPRSGCSMRIRASGLTDSRALRRRCRGPR